MIPVKDFICGLQALADASKHSLSDGQADAYGLAILPHLTDPSEWSAFVAEMLRAGRWRWFPLAVEIQDALREFRGAPSLDAEAVRAYERVTAAGEYTAQAGTVWTYRRVLTACGRVAADAFLAAGGSSAWVTLWRETERRQAFCAAYLLAARQEPAGRLLPAAPAQAQITDGTSKNSGDNLSPGEAAVLLGRVRERLAIPAEPAQPRMTEAEAEVRLAELRRQAEQIQEGA